MGTSLSLILRYTGIGKVRETDYDVHDVELDFDIDAYRRILYYHLECISSSAVIKLSASLFEPLFTNQISLGACRTHLFAFPALP